MKQVKFLLLPLFALVISFGVKAQDINAVVEQFNKGNDAFKAENYQKAIADLEAAYTAAIAITDEDAAETVEGIKTNCKNMIPFSYSAVAGLFASEGKYDESVEYFNKSLTAAEKYGNTEITRENVTDKINAVYSVQANNYAKDGEFAKAVESIAKTGDNDAIDKINKYIAVAYLKEAQTAQKAKDYKTAVEKSKQATEYNSESESAYLILGVCYSQLKQYKNAVDALEKCIALKESAQAYYYLAAAYQQSGNNAKACQNYKKVNDPKLSANAQAQMKVVCK
ncbi:MAG: CDC27 family protein [Prevotellaceae bacterium]|jgi:tetratricopeptide (TPR) repeat protein|nr:CDC27 family protein [Prevotellaceae bacterium]